MKKLYCLCTLLVYGLASIGQQESEIGNNDLHRNSKDTVGIVHEPDQPASYPGGRQAWNFYLLRALRGDQALDEMRRKRVKEQTAVVQFVVCANGTICEVQVINEVLPSVSREAQRVIKNAGTWLPAQKDGKEVKAYKRQSITFMIER